MAAMDEKIPGEDTGGIFGGIFNSPYAPALMVAFSSGLKATGLFKHGNALVEAAGRKQQAAEFEAQQLTVNAGQAKAASQREAYFKGLEGEQLISAIRARAGGGATDPTVLNIIGAAMARTAYNKESLYYAGEEKSRLMEMQAKSKRYDAELGMQDAKSARGTYQLAGVGALGEGASLFQKYWPAKKGEMGGQTPAQTRADEAMLDEHWNF